MERRRASPYQHPSTSLARFSASSSRSTPASRPSSIPPVSLPRFLLRRPVSVSAPSAFSLCALSLVGRGLLRHGVRSSPAAGRLRGSSDRPPCQNPTQPRLPERDCETRETAAPSQTATATDELSSYVWPSAYFATRAPAHSALCSARAACSQCGPSTVSSQVAPACFATQTIACLDRQDGRIEKVFG